MKDSSVRVPAAGRATAWRRGRSLIAIAAAASVAIVGGVVSATPAAAAEEVLAVDFAASTGAFKGGASGMLYGLSDEGVPTDAITAGARPLNVTQKAPHGQQHPNGDPLDVEDSFFDAGGEYLMVNIQDYYPDWPYNGGRRPSDFSTYLDIVRTVVTSIVEESDHPEKYVFTPFNEPDGGNWYANWSTMKGTFLADWKAAYEVIKEVYPEARIAGMGDTGWRGARTRDILTFAKANNVLPDMFTWHELGVANLGTFRSHYDEYRQIERDLGIEPLPVNITEYAMRRDMSVPGQLVQWLAMFEDTKVDAQTAYWTYAGNLNDNMAKSNSANGAWWLLKWYADLSGDTVKLTPPALDKVDSLQGIATLDADKKLASVVFGGGSQDVRVQLAGLSPDVFGGAVDIQVREAGWSGQEGEALTPPVVAAQRVELTGGTVEITVPNNDRLSAFQLIVTPALEQQPVVDDTWTTSVEAENTELSNVVAYNQPMSDAWLFAASNQRDVGSTNKVGSALTWRVTVPETGTYRFGVTAGINGPSIGPGRHALFVDGVQAATIEYEAGFAWSYRGRAEVLIDLAAGEHALSVRMSADGATLLPGSDISLDKFDLTRVTGPDTATYPAVLARFGDAVVNYGEAAPRGAVQLEGDDTATFFVAGRDTGYYDVKVEYTTAQAANVQLTVNGRSIQGLSAPQAGTWTSTARVHLAEGIAQVQVATPEGIALQEIETVRAAEADGAIVRIQAEDATQVALRGSARVEQVGQPTNVSGSQVGWLGGGAANTAEITRPSSIRAGAYDLQVRYANAERNTGHAYNTDVVSRFLDIAEAGGGTAREAFRHNYSWKGFWTHTVPLELATDTGKITLGNATGHAPNIDWVAFAPFVLEVGTDGTATPALNVSTAVSTRCLGGKIRVDVTATNDDAQRVDVVATSDYGTKTFPNVKPGKEVGFAFNTRAAEVAAGTVTFAATAVVDGETVTATATAEHPAATCE